MPDIPWTPAPASNRELPSEVVLLGSKLELRSYRHIVGFLRDAMKVRKQVVGSTGAVGIALRARPLRKTFWTLSAWTDQPALDSFVRASPHREVMTKYQGRLLDTGFVTWTSAASELPAKNSNAGALWDAAHDRLART